MLDVQDVGCSRCEMFRMWDVWDINVQNVECLGCRMFGMWIVQDVGCSG